MGLDNGLIARNVPRKNVPKWIKNPPWHGDNDEVEIAYFRKYWGLRGEILSLLDSPKNNNDYEIIVNRDQLGEIAKLLCKYFNKKYYDSHANSIWEYKEALYTLEHSILNVLWLRRYMKKHPEVECYFYDSY